LAAKREELRRRLDTVIREQDAVADEVVRLRILIADLERELASKPDAPSFADRASEKNDSQRKRRPNAPSDAS
jgi:cell division septum initiation protein DivIVA